MAFWLKYRGKLQGSHYQIDTGPLLAIPIVLPPADVKSAVEALVDRVLDAESAISAARTSAEVDQLTRLREQWDSEIQEKIEGLYGMSAEERTVLASEMPSDEASDSAEAACVA